MTMIVGEGSPTVRVEPDEVPERHENSLTVLFAELVGPNGFSGQDQDRENTTHEAIVRSNRLATDIIQKHRGQIIKTMGGSVMAEFSDPSSAVRAAVEMERLLAESNRTLAQHEQIGLRIGIHGLPGESQGIDAFGGIIHVTANITKHAASGQILISREVCDAVSKETDLHCQWFRTVALSGTNEGGDVFEVHWAESSASIPSRYEVLSQVGTGGMGIVYKVRDRETDDIIALKILKSEIAADPAMQENLRREVCLARKVTHKNVCRIHEFNRSNGAAYISMEFVEGESLLSRLHRNGPLPWNEALKIARQICSGLREAHVQGIVHRDLKPANIMADRNGFVKIMDFGIARLFQGTGHMTGTLVGTPAYMAPEQVELNRVDARTDVYALGLLLYEIVTGVPAFEGETPIAVALKQLREFPKRPREIVPTLPVHAEAVILKCLQKDPAKRFQSVDALTAALKGESRAKPVVSMRASFVADFQRSGHDLYLSLQPGIEVACNFLRRQKNWHASKAKREQVLLAVGLGAACLLSGLVVFAAWHGNPKRQVAARNSTAAAMQAEGASVQEALSSSSSIDADRTFARAPESSARGLRLPGDAPLIGYEVDLGSTSGRTSQENGSSAMESQRQLPSDTDASRAEQRVKVQAPRVAAPSLTARRVTLSMATQARLPQPDVAVTLPSPKDEVLNRENTENAPSEPSSNVIPDTPASTPVEATTTEKTTEDNSALSGSYLEVGSFKDPIWADHAVEKLTQLGLRAVSVRKNLLWMQSYQVRVGPYADTRDLEAARAVLVSQGFKPHPVK